MKNLILLVWGAGTAVCLAADYTWLADPESADWLTGVNWSAGAGATAWTAGTGDTATFSASSETTVNVDGPVALAALTVTDADYTFTNQTLTVNGPVRVASGVTATVAGPLAQTDATAANRFVKGDAGTLVVKGSAATTNRFQRLATTGGDLVFDGGVHTIDVTDRTATETQMPFNMRGGRLVVTGGARVEAKGGAYCNNAWGEILVTNGTFTTYNPATSNSFMNAYGTGWNNTTPARITVSDKGRFEAWTLRASQYVANSGCAVPSVITVSTGGTLSVYNIYVDKGGSNGANPYTGEILFDGGNLVLTNNSNPGSVARFGDGDITKDGRWRNLSVKIGAGGLNLTQNALGWYRKGFSSGAEHDGGIHLHGSSVPYLDATNTFNGGIHLYDKVILATFKDTALGAVPSVPTDGIFLRSGDATFHAGSSYASHKYRDFLINTNTTGILGTQNGCLFSLRGRIHGVEPDGRSARLRISLGWAGLTSIDTAENRTNLIGRLWVEGRVQFGAGTTLITSNTVGGVHENCAVYIVGKKSNGYDSNYGNVTITGGVFRVTTSSYTELKDYGQLNVKGGLFDVSSREWLNGLDGAGRTTVSGGELLASQLRISQWWECDADGLPVCSVNVQTGGTVRTKCFYIDRAYGLSRGCLNLDGGVVIARENRTGFLGDYAPVNGKPEQDGSWTNVLVRVCAGGAIFDTTNFNISIQAPLLSAAAADGGLTKRGSGTLTIANATNNAVTVNANTYNGVTRVEAGTLVFAREGAGFPGGDIAFTAQGLAKGKPLLKVPTLAFRAGKGLRVENADLLDDRTFGKARTVLELTKSGATLDAVPSVSFIASDGTVLSTVNGWRGWTFQVTAQKKALAFGPVRATVIILR